MNRLENVSVTPVQYSPGRRIKKKAIQVRSAMDFPLGDLHWAIESMQWRIETRRKHTIPGGVFFRVGRKLLSQAKIDGAHGVESCVWGPHGHEYLSHGADVLLHASFVDRLVAG